MIAKNDCFAILLLHTVSLLILAQCVFAQGQPATDVSILESRFSTTTPVIGDTLKYFLKYDYREGISVIPVEYLSENGLTIIETKKLDPQIFEGRVIQQFEYTTIAQEAGEHQFIPAAIHYAGPLQNPLAAQADPVQIHITEEIDVQVVTNSPLMLNEPLEFRLAVTKHKPVTIIAMPHDIQAEFQVSAPPTEQEQKETPTSVPMPSPLHFALDQTQQVTPRQMEGQTVEEYSYNVLTSPEQAGEYMIPEITVTYRTSGGEERQIRTEATPLFILNPNTANVDIQTDYRFLAFPAILLAVILVISSSVALFLIHRKKRRQSQSIMAPPPLPWELARQELAHIQALKLLSKGEFKAYYTMISESVRKFLGAEFGFPVLERTTEEVIEDMRHRDVPEHIKAHTSKFLQEADMVKFAKYLPLLEEAGAAMEQAVTIVDEGAAYHQKITEQTDAEEETGEHPPTDRAS